MAAVGLFVSIQVSSCQASVSSDQDEHSVFLDALSGPIREKYPDSVLIDEGNKACDAFAQGQSEEQVMKMIKTDLNVDAGQFIGAVYGGMNCGSK